MELQILKPIGKWLAVIFCLGLASCEKEIEVKLPPTAEELVVEACINTRVPTMNYVFVSRTVDYFNPNISLLGINDADVFVTEGEIRGKDTLYDANNRIPFFNINVDTFRIAQGVYINPLFVAQAEKPYKLEIFYQNHTVTGITVVPAAVPIIETNIKMEGISDGKPQGYLTFKFFDPPGPSYYRIALTFNKSPFLLGFGDAFQLRRTDDRNVDNQIREYAFHRPYSQGDTLNLYLCRLGFKEFKFWESFSEVQNNDGPFATPAKLRSTLTGAIGSFTGYNIDHKTIIVQ